MITAILVSLVVLFLGFIATGLSDHSFSSTRVDRKRVATFHAAEAGIEESLELLQTTALASLPCASPVAGPVDAGTGASDYVVTFTYYATSPPSGAPLACPLSAEPASVVLAVNGDSTDPLGRRRRLEATVDFFVPTGVGAFDRTVFSDLTIEYDGPVQLHGSPTGPAIVATNAGIACDQVQALQGSLHAQTTIALSAGCDVGGDVRAGTAITASGAVVGGSVVSSTSTVGLSNGTTVLGDVTAAGAITNDGTATVQGSSSSGGGPIPLPPTIAFPAVTDVAGAWTSAGYTPRNPPSCAAAVSDLVTAAPLWATPHVMRVSGCKLTTTNETITLKNDVAILADGGFEFGSGTRFTGVPGARLSLIVPSGSSCAGTSGRITMGAGMRFDAPLEVFAYTPCLLHAQNAGLMLGQLYGGQVRFGAFHLAYRPVDQIPGYTPTTLSVDRRATLLAKREVVL